MSDRDVTEEDLVLPPLLDTRYQIRSCVRCTSQSAAYLLEERASGRTVLLKTAADPLYARSLTNEKQVLDRIHQQKEQRLSASFPYSISLMEHSGITYYIRSFIPGRTLEEICETNYSCPGIEASCAVDYLLELTELLHFLHTMEPPLIHRDIKPQNVVVDPDGVCHFIDLGIARFYKEEGQIDTQIMGTRATAAPEQFGYRQTDIRSDLYSIGVLLLYCLTGDYSLSETNLQDVSPALRAIIRKATMFDPDKRYQTSQELFLDLLSVRYQTMLPADQTSKEKTPLQSAEKNASPHSNPWRLLSAILGSICICMFAAFMALYGREQIKSTFASEEAYEFREPLIEQAVRTTLNLPEAPITEAVLQQVTELHIMGQQVFASESDFDCNGEYIWVRDDAARESGLYEQLGTISSLEDLTHMPNLKSVGLYHQLISDISPLEDTQIADLGLGYNPLTDLSPLSGNTSVRSLNLASLEIADLNVISTLPNLETLNISNTKLTALAGLEKCSLHNLNLFETPVEDYRPLWDCKSLEALQLTSITDEIKEQLDGLPIRDVHIHACTGTTLAEFSIFPELEALYYDTNAENNALDAMPQLPGLRSLTLSHTSVESLKPLTSLTSLETLGIFSCDCGDFDGLDELSSLQSVSCTASQKEQLEALYPEREFQLYYE